MGRMTGLALIAGVGAAMAQGVPATGRWTTSGLAPFPINRSELQGEAIDGRFYIVGGQCQCPGGGSTPDMYIYDAQANSWTKGPDMPGNRHHVATAAWEGKFYVLGGIDQDLESWPWDRGETNNWMYDPATKAWTELPPMPERVGAGDAEAVGGRIYVAGGILEGENIAQARTLEYDIAAKTWARKADMNAAREHFRMAAVGNRIYAAAGRHNHQDVKVFEAYDIPTNTWVKLKDLPTTRGGVAVQALGGRVYVMGGEGANASIGLFDDVDEYDPAADSWRKMQDMPVTVHGMAGIVHDGKIWVVAGSNPFGHQPKNYNYHFTPPVYSTGIIHPRDGIPQPALALANGELSLRLPYAADVILSFYDAKGAVKAKRVAGLLAEGVHSLEAGPGDAGFAKAVIAGGARNRIETRFVRLPR